MTGRADALPRQDQISPVPSTGTQRARRTHEAIWMQTTGALLLVVQRCSLACVPMTAQDGRSARRLLYLAAARDDSYGLEHLPPI